MPKIDYFFTLVAVHLFGGGVEKDREKVRAWIQYRPLDVVSLLGAQAVLPCLIGIRPGLIIVHRI